MTSYLACSKPKPISYKTLTYVITVCFVMPLSSQKIHNAAFMAIVLELRTKLLCHHSKNVAIVKWFWSFATNPAVPEITPIGKFQTLYFTIYILRGNTQHLTWAFFPGRGNSWDERSWYLGLSQDNWGTEYKNFNSEEAHKNYGGDGGQMPYTSSEQAITWLFQDSYV